MKRAVLLLVAACHSHDKALPGKNDLFDTIAIHVPPGISDLTLDDKGHLWAIAERDRVATEMTPDGATIADHIVAIPLGVDTEAIAFLGGGRFAIGTEGEDVPTAAIVFAKLDEHGVLQPTATRDLTSAELGVTLVKNHGVEAVCGHGDEVLAAIETVGKDDHGRYAPLVHLRGDQMTVGRLRLTSDVGKISALACAWQPDGSIDIHAVERHYKVSRILHGTLAAGATDLAPTVQIDLEPVLHDSLNVEGLVVLPDGHLEAVNDNQGSTVSGPTVLMRFK
jgi:hypothetical protein